VVSTAADGMTWKTGLSQFVVSIVVQFYTAFVLMLLWNWFVTRALHTSEIGYLTVYGLLLIVQLFRTATSHADELKHRRILTMLDACIRDDQREAMADELIEINKETTNVPTWLIVETLVGNTVALAVGWFIHTLNV
jgi:hypothetical protein